MSQRNKKPSRRAQQPVAVDIGARIRAARQRRGLSAIAVATKAQMTAPHLSNAENGRVEPRLATLTVLADAIGCPLSELLPLSTATREQLVARVRQLPDVALPELDHLLGLLERAFIGTKNGL